ncbi:hypothetical protein F4782DRAFT_403585 [Xylaria castorea]|nr:hypothetical protein F4782DRAFT_403585 [Xylaria castorea]
MSGGWKDVVKSKTPEIAGGLKDVVKGGWHPEKSGSTLKSQVKGLVGRGDSSEPREQHVATPRSSLRDPSSFGPPPKHVAAYGRTTTAQAQPSAGAAASSSTPIQSSAADPIASQTYGSRQPYQAQHAVEEESPAEPRPYRVDTSGLSTSHLPPPPTRPSGAGGRAPQTPATYSPALTATTQAAVTAKPRVPPSLPPRLPPRSGNSTPTPTISSEQAAIQGHLNQGAINRLGAAGISVPGFGIGLGGGTPPPPTRSPSQAPAYGQVDELQARFARMGASSSAQANSNETAATSGAQQRPIGQVPSLLGKKKPPPPPMPKKPELSGTRAESADAPPPIPLATRPRFD